MSGFETFIIVDWSGGNDTGPRPRADAIWVAVHAAGQAEPPVYLRNRVEAEDWLSKRLAQELAAGRRVLAGFDFAFGYPAGFGEALTGSADPLALWQWFAQRVDDSPKANNRFDLAGEINRGFDGIGPFWGNGLKREIADLPRKGTARSCTTFAERRQAEQQAKGAFPVWQLSGVGAVGSQVIMGLPVLERLRQSFAGKVAVWPFEPLDRPVAFVEIWPSLIAPAVREAAAAGGIKDAHQVRLVAAALAALPGAELAQMLDVPATPEGSILGLGREARLIEAARGAVLAPPPLREDCFALPPGVDWLPVDEALALLRARLRPADLAVETVPVAKFAGRRLAKAPQAARANPPGANSAVDGYGFAYDALGPGPHRLPLATGRAAAGGPFEGVLPKGQAVRILTGALLPEGVDTVVLEENCASDGSAIAFQGPVKRGANTRKAGEDVEAGAALLEAGHLLRPVDLALLSAVGLAEVPVRARLRVGVLSTGDELIDPVAGADPSQTFDANRPMLLSLAGAWGHGAVDLGRAGDNRARLAKRLDRAAARCDVILTSGGASAGDEDHVSALLRDAGTLTAWRIALKPGRPLALGHWQGVPVFGLPGNPVAALVCALIFARPALSVLAGGGWLEPQAFTVPAGFAKSKKPGRREFLRARIGLDGRAEVFASEGSGRISGLGWAEGLVELPDGALAVNPGNPVRYLPYAGFGL